MIVKKIFLIILIFLAVGIILNSNLNYSFAASGKDQFNASLKSTADKAGYKDSEAVGESILITRIAKVVEIILSFVGVIFLILTIYAGFTWMMAAGNEQQVEKARKVLIASIIGLLIVLSAYAISYMVVSKFGGKTLGQGESTWGVSPGI